MIRLIPLLFCLFINYSFAQETQEVTLPTDSKGAPIFQQDFKLGSSESSKSIIAKAETWVSESSSSENFIGHQYDPDNDTLVALGISRFSLPFSFSNNGKTRSTEVPFKLRYVLTVKSKTGQYRAIINNLIVQRNMPGGDSNSQQLPPKSPTVEQHYQTMKNLPYTENEKRVNAEISVGNWNKILSTVNHQMRTLLQSLEMAMKQPATKN